MGLSKATILILAAGRSSRMGIPKGLLNYHGQSWLLQQLEWIKQNGPNKVILVLGFQSESYLNQISWLGKSLNSWHEYNNIKIKTIINPRPELGSFSSLQKAIPTLLQLNLREGFFMLPIDVPCPNKLTLEKLFPIEHEVFPAVTTPIFKNQGGHPVYLNRAFLEKLNSVPINSIDARLDQQIASLENQNKISVEDSRVILNLNFPEEWEDFSKLS